MGPENTLTIRRPANDRSIERTTDRPGIRHWALRKIDNWLSWIAACGEDEVVVQMINELAGQHHILTPYNLPRVETADRLHVQARRERGNVRIRWARTDTRPSAPVNVLRRTIPSSAWLQLNDTPVAGGEFVDVTAVSRENYGYAVVPADQPASTPADESMVLAIQMSRVKLSEARLNDARSHARVSYTLSDARAVTLRVQDSDGRMVSLLDDGMRAPGRHYATLDCRSLRAGEYYIRLDVGADQGRASEFRAARLTLHG